MRLVYFPKFCRTIVSIFLWVLHSSQEKIEDDRLAIFFCGGGGGGEGGEGIQGANSEF